MYADAIRAATLLARRLPPDVSEIPLRRLASSEESWAMVQNLRERMGKPRHKGDAEDVGQGAAKPPRPCRRSRAPREPCLVWMFAFGARGPRRCHCVWGGGARHSRVGVHPAAHGASETACMRGLRGRPLVNGPHARRSAARHVVFFGPGVARL